MPALKKASMCCNGFNLLGAAGDDENSEIHEQKGSTGIASDKNTAAVEDNEENTSSGQSRKAYVH